MQKYLPAFRSFFRYFAYSKLVENTFFRSGSLQKINGEEIIIPFRFRRFYPPVYEVEKARFIKKYCKPGTTAIDIGAHIGIFSVLMARYVGKEGKVYSFEPTPFTFEVLEKTVRLNHLENIIDARPLAVNNKQSEEFFYVHRNSIISNANSIVNRSGIANGVEAIKVQTIYLDQILEKDVSTISFIKIDAEGAELEILQGGKGLIEKHRPYITLEVHPRNFENPGKKQKEIFSFIKKLGYDILKDNTKIQEAEFCSIPDCFEVFLIPPDL